MSSEPFPSFPHLDILCQQEVKWINNQFPMLNGQNAKGISEKLYFDQWIYITNNFPVNAVWLVKQLLHKRWYFFIIIIIYNINIAHYIITITLSA
jgi:hypothetical protein